MYEHAGPACALSGLIVALFAVLLHDRAPDPAAPATQSRRPSPKKAGVVPPSPLPESIRKPASVEGPATLPGPPKAVPRVEPVPSPATDRGPRRDPEVVASAGRPAAAPAGPPKMPPPASPRPAFAVVGPGETLPDVAARVYGTREAAVALWRANRDQVERVDSSLAGGTLLRTP